MTRVKEFARLGKGDFRVVLADGTEGRLSRRHRDALRAEFGWPV